MSPFSARRGRMIGAVALASLVAAGWLLVSPGDSGGISVAADGYSRSALGHAALVRWLRELGEPVVQLRMARPIEPCGLLVFAEPRALQSDDAARIEDWIDAAGATLIVLPKRTGRADPDRADWVASVELLPPADVDAVFEEIASIVGVPVPPVVRVAAPTSWQALPAYGTPTLTGPVQLLADQGTVEPWIWCPDGVLLGAIGDLVVLADPDVLNNQGLPRGDNARIVLAALRRLRGDGTVVFDETLHGHRIEPSVWHALGTFPLVLVPIHLLLLLALVGWIAMDRFGPVQPAPRAIAAGKQFLIDNVAVLLARAGHHGHAVRRYRRLCVRRAAARLHAPPGCSFEQAVELLLRRAGAGEARQRLEAVLSEDAAMASAADAAALAGRIQRETEEIVHGRR